MNNNTFNNIENNPNNFKDISNTFNDTFNNLTIHKEVKTMNNNTFNKCKNSINNLSVFNENVFNAYTDKKFEPNIFSINRKLEEKNNSRKRKFFINGKIPYLEKRNRFSNNNLIIYDVDNVMKKNSFNNNNNFNNNFNNLTIHKEVKTMNNNTENNPNNFKDIFNDTFNNLTIHNEEKIMNNNTFNNTKNNFNENFFNNKNLINNNLDEISIISKKTSESKSKLQKILMKNYDPEINNFEDYNWDKIARFSQRMPKDPWYIWMILAGRGFGKTRTGAESIKKLVETNQYKNIALIGQTNEETRRIMVEGVSGILSTYHPLDQMKPIFESSNKRLIWGNGAVAHIFGADYYEQLRGPQFDLVWIDEFAKFKHVEEIMEQIMMCLRVGENPKCIITTTPKPLKIIKEIMADKLTKTTIGSTFENEKNLSPEFLKIIKNKFENTQLGRQELYAEILDEDENALWKRSIIRYDVPKNLEEVVIAVDPAVTSGKESDETGIVVCGADSNDISYVLDDLSGKYPPLKWAEIVRDAFYKYNADRIIVETNQGGDLIKQMLFMVDDSLPIKEARAFRGKSVRAEPIAAMYEQGKVFHKMPFKKLEDEMCSFSTKNNEGKNNENGKSPDRMDAMVWGITDLVKQECPIRFCY